MYETGFPSVFDTDLPYLPVVRRRTRLEVLKDKLMKELRLQHLNKAERIRVLNLLTYVCRCYDNGCVEKDSATSTTEGIHTTEVITTTESLNNTEGINTTADINFTKGIDNTEDITNTESISHTANSNNTAKLDNAFRFNDEAIELSEWTNVASILYRAHLMEEIGDQLGVEHCRVKLQEMRSSPGYQLMLADAQAEVAYTFYRLGGLYNIRRAIHWYQEALKNDTIDDWKFGLGLANSHVVCWYRNSRDIDICEINKHINSAVSKLMEVAENSSDAELRSISYSKLAVLKRVLKNAKLETENCRLLYKGLDVQSLVLKAMEFDPKNPKTLRDCGRLLKQFDVDKAIEALEKSVKETEHSLTYHNLGICYEIKARKNAGRAKNEIKRDDNVYLDGVSESCEQVLPDQENIENKEDTVILQISDSTKQISLVSASNRSDQDDVSNTAQISPVRDSRDLVLIPGLTSPGNLQVSKQIEENPNDDALCSLVLSEEPPDGFEIVHSGTAKGRRRKKKKKNNIASYINCPIIVSPLDRQDQYVDMAIEYHQKSIQVSSDGNYPAMYTLGLILRSCGCLQEAKKYFQKIVDSYSLEIHENAVKPDTLICAHLQLGLCILDNIEQSEADYDECESQMLKAIDAVGTLTSDSSVAAKLRQGLSEIMGNVRQRGNADAQKPRNAFRKLVNSIKKKVSAY